MVAKTAHARYLQRPSACQVDRSWNGVTAVLQPVLGEHDKRALKQVTVRCDQQVAEKATARWIDRLLEHLYTHFRNVFVTRDSCVILHDEMSKR
jgi:hypothetical protein